MEFYEMECVGFLIITTTGCHEKMLSVLSPNLVNEVVLKVARQLLLGEASSSVIELSFSLEILLRISSSYKAQQKLTHTCNHYKGPGISPYEDPHHQQTSQLKTPFEQTYSTLNKTSPR